MCKPKNDANVIPLLIPMTGQGNNQCCMMCCPSQGMQPMPPMAPPMAPPPRMAPPMLPPMAPPMPCVSVSPPVLMPMPTAMQNICPMTQQRLPPPMPRPSMPPMQMSPPMMNPPRALPPLICCLLPSGGPQHMQSGAQFPTSLPQNMSSGISAGGMSQLTSVSQQQQGGATYICRPISAPIC